MPNIAACPGETTPVAFLTKNQILVASGTGTVAGVDVHDYIGGICLVLNTSTPVADGSTTFQASVLHSTDNSTFTTWATAPTFAPITGTVGFLTANLDTRDCNRYVQAKYVVTGTTATFTASMIGYGIKAVQ